MSRDQGRRPARPGGEPGADADPGGRRRGPVVTLDGPAGSGKSSTARAVARRLDFRHLDSGALYRALTYALLEAGVEPEAWAGLGAGDLEAFPVTLEPAGDGFHVVLAGAPVPDEALRSSEVTAHVSSAAAIPAVRQWLLGQQRAAARKGRVVADGRDMGTVVFPDADVKVFLTAALEERARRRLAQQGHDDPSKNEVDDEARRIRKRDEVDAGRDVSPLRRPPDAVVLDTTELDFDAQVDAVVELVREAVGQGSDQPADP